MCVRSVVLQTRSLVQHASRSTCLPHLTEQVGGVTKQRTRAISWSPYGGVIGDGAIGYNLHGEAINLEVSSYGCHPRDTTHGPMHNTHKTLVSTGSPDTRTPPPHERHARALPNSKCVGPLELFPPPSSPAPPSSPSYPTIPRARICGIVCAE